MNFTIMDKDTKIELLKVFGMIIILVVLIFGIVYLNKAHDVSINETNTVIKENTTKETNKEKSDISNKSSKDNNNKKKD